jgi:hypothetical protein
VVTGPTRTDEGSAHPDARTTSEETSLGIVTFTRPKERHEPAFVVTSDQ